MQAVQNTTQYFAKSFGQKVCGNIWWADGFYKEEEDIFTAHILAQSEWGFPVDYLDLRLIAKAYIDKSNRIVLKFSQNLPSEDWVRSFVKRNDLTTRLCQNITCKRSHVSPEIIETYFNNLAQTIDGVATKNIMNYDETNLSDDCGKKKFLFRRGLKYPERIMNCGSCFLNK